MQACLPRYYDQNGQKRVAGGAGLRSTQLYTPEFGRGLATWWSSNAPVSSGTGNSLMHMCQSIDVARKFWFEPFPYSAGEIVDDGACFKVLI